ncbi:helix-turn-helix domain-containing protein [Geothrix sp. PMB-07]|uniref:helix-turn-helix domain-containing protein n=1 Tax=Geothrix sp. PMB-07 TaxID=3068640 RepID=UPI002740E99E|nr:helix-turn-helix domain-containing protein [Geothrix sp. PMB-07]WLT30072.1 helix-turn-helix domain-containing protein [Geothrix sp. PMB-07]
MEFQPMLSLRTISLLAGVSRQRVLREIAAGHLKAHTVGKRTVILASDLVEWLGTNPSNKQGASSVKPTVPLLAGITPGNPMRYVQRIAYSVAEFAALTSLSIKTIHRQIADGRLRGLKIGPKGRLVIPAEAAEEWLRSLQVRKVG